MNIVLIVPTGLGCEIGGHAGDANPVAKLLGSCCDKLILHPNVVNASDINEMPPNAIYVEGSVLDRFLEGEIGLKELQSGCNRVLVAVNSPLRNETVNTVSAARVTIGLDAEIVVLETPFVMIATKAEDGRATGEVRGHEQLVEQVRDYDFDALAIVTPIMIEKEVALNYLRNGGVNPWGGVEARASRLVADALNKPVAHAPMAEKPVTFIPPPQDTLAGFNEIIDPRMAAEVVSVCYVHCVLKGLHRAPRIVDTSEGLNVGDVDCLVTPVGCIGRPHRACMARGIPIIAVEENRSCLNQRSDEFIYVENYLEAAGLLMAMKSGVSPASIRRPVQDTKIH